MNNKHNRIAIVAYTLWEYAGKPDGRDLEFWFTAERIIPSPLPWGWEKPERTEERQKMNNKLRSGHGEAERYRICDCDLCQYSRKVSEVIASRDPERLIEVVNELMLASYNIGDDLDYLRCVFDGSWPSAVEQLEKALERAKVHPNRKIDAAVHYG